MKSEATCKDALLYLFQNDTETSLKALDAFGKVPPGVLVGNTAWWGDYDECTAIEGFKYCSVNLQINASTNGLSSATLDLPDYGLCAPNVCSENDIIYNIDTLTSLLPSLSWLSLGNPTAKSVHCQEQKPLDDGLICFMSLCIVIILLMLAGAAVDIFQSHKKRKSNQMTMSSTVRSPASRTYNSFGKDKEAGASYIPDEEKPLLANTTSNGAVTDTISNGAHNRNGTAITTQIPQEGSKSSLFQEILLCFAFNRNLRKLLDTKQSDKSIGCLNGIRVISISWVILGHAYFFSLFPNPENKLQLLSQPANYFYQAVGNAFLSVDTFFFLSGFLVAYLTLAKMKESDGKIPLALFYFHRIWRLTPLYAFVILFSIFAFPYFGNGPIWYIAQNQLSKGCRKYWWRNLLYINNFFPAGEQCLLWSWYLSNDMQFYLISPLLLFPIFWSQAIGLCVITALLLVSFVVTATLIGYYDLTTNLYGILESLVSALSASDSADFFSLVYQKPYCRIAPYLVGFVVGYFTLKQVTERRKIRISPVRVAIGWTLASVVGITVVYGTYPSFQAGLLQDGWSTTENIFYGTFSRFAWALSISWVVLACHYGYGGWVNDFLCWSLWTPLSRLTYSAYLVHGLIYYFYYLSLTSPFHGSSAVFVFIFCGTLMLSYAAAMLFSLAIEYPFANLEKILLRGTGIRKRQKTDPASGRIDNGDQSSNKLGNTP